VREDRLYFDAQGGRVLPGLEAVGVIAPRKLVVGGFNPSIRRVRRQR
jgi:hypothetical protein